MNVPLIRHARTITHAEARRIQRILWDRFDFWMDLWDCSFFWGEISEDYCASSLILPEDDAKLAAYLKEKIDKLIDYKKELKIYGIIEDDDDLSHE